MGERERRGIESRRGLGRCGLAASLAIAALVLLSAAPASASWTPSFTLAKAAGSSHPFIPRVAIAPDGTSVFLWERDGALQTRVRAPGGTLSPVQAIAPPNTVGGHHEADVAVDSDGNAMYVWAAGVYGYSIRVRVRHANGTLGPVQTLATAPSDDDATALEDLHVGFDGTGRAVISWIRGRYQKQPILQTRSRSPAGVLGPVLTVGRSGFYSKLAVTSDGRAFYAWQSRDGVFGRAMNPGGTLGPLQQMSTSGDAVQLAASGGTAVFSWWQGTGNYARIMARERWPGGSLGPPEVIASGGLLSSSSQAVALAPDGTSAFCWLRGISEARIRSPSGDLGPIQALGQNSSPSVACQVRTDSSGDFVFADGFRTDDYKDRVFARTQPAGGALGPMHVLSPAGYNAHAVDLDVNAAGDVAAAWMLGDRGFAIQAAVGP